MRLLPPKSAGKQEKVERRWSLCKIPMCGDMHQASNGIGAVESSGDGKAQVKGSLQLGSAQLGAFSFAVPTHSCILVVI